MFFNKSKTATKHKWNPNQVEYLNPYLLYEPNSAPRAFTADRELQFHISVPSRKIVQNVKFLSVNQNSYSILKLNPTRQHESSGMLDFQNRVTDTKLLKFYTNQDERVYLEKCDFQRKLVCQI